MNDSVFIDDDGAIYAAASAVVAANRDAGLTVALAESCTGGMVSAAITDVPGSSDVLQAGYVTYADAAKQRLLRVSPDIIETFGAVSVACVWAMARGALEQSGADIAVAVSGIAGPGGGSASKPVGTVVFGRAVRGEPASDIHAQQVVFDAAGGRATIRRQATLFALGLLLPTAMDAP